MSKLSHTPDDINPDDSASQCSRASSKASSTARLKAMAKRAALAAEAAALQEQHELELEELKLRQRKSQLALNTKLRIAEAEERVYAEHKTKSEVSPVIPVQGSIDSAQDQTLAYPVRSEKSVSTESVLVQMLQQGQQHQQQLMDTMRLPHTELMHYDGNPLKYWEFWRAFHNTVDSTSVHESIKLSHLYNHCVGEVRKVMEACMVMEPREGYHSAKFLLQERYGNSFKIADAWMRKVTEGNKIHPSNKFALREFADELGVCLQTLQAMGHKGELSPQSVLYRIVERLPNHLHGRWLKAVSGIRKQCRLPQIEDVVQFVQNASDEENDPVYGRLTDRGSNIVQSGKTGYWNKAKEQPKGLCAVASSQGNEERPKKECPLCQEMHTLFGCEQFKKKSPQDRLNFARDNRLCYNCLLCGHMQNECTLNRTCSVPGCGRKHTRFLHIIRRESTPFGAEAPRSEQSPIHDETPSQNGFIDTTSDSSFGNATGAGKRCVLPIVPVRVQSSAGGKCLRTYALLDSGSTNSFCTESLAQKLSASRQKQKLSLTTLNSESIIDTDVVSLVVDTGPMTDRVNLSNVFTKDNINISSSHMASMDEISGWSHLQGINLPFACGQEVGILIGQDTPAALMPLEVRRAERGPYAIRTVLGWSLHGPVSAMPEGAAQEVSSNFIDGECQLEAQVERFWKLESIEASNILDEERGMSINDRRAIDTWQEGKCMEGGHYQLPIPFKHRPPELPNNRWIAEQRLESLRRKLNRDDTLCCKYKEGIADLLEKGYCEEVKEEESLPDDTTPWYLPHHPVLHALKPDKVRIVFDCASKCRGVSLNDVVHQGPDLTNKLIGVLIRFRQEPIAMMADIEAMFHQVQVPRSDRDVLRFLWWPSGDMTAQPKIYRMCVHLFGGTWSPSCCSYALHQTAEDNRAECNNEVVNMVKHNFYVDDCLVSVDDEQKAIEIAAGLRSLLMKGGFKLTKWLSNHPSVLESIPREERSKQVKGLDLNHDALPVDRALGLSWNVETDCFVYKTVPKEKPLTRRGLLSVVSSIYDPMGFICPYILKAKCILQELCRIKLRWDDAIPEPEKQEWQEWIEDLPEMSNMSVNRCIKPHNFGQVKDYQLHHFSDASEKAYGAVSYLMMVNTEGKVCCSLLMAKSRLAPLKKVTIPRLELMAAALVTRLDDVIKKELDVTISKSTFWTDSTIVLRYIKNEDKRFLTFVANRVATIRNKSDPSQWHYVDTKSNPADDATRGMTANELKTKERWLHGPKFLYQDETEWPKDPTDVDSEDDSDLEFKSKVKSFSAESHDTCSDYTSDFLCHYSSWYRLKRAVCWMQRFFKWLKSKSNSTETLRSRLTLNEMKQAEEKVLWYEQRKAFHEEIDALKLPQSADDGRKQKWKTVKKSSKIYKLDPRMENGLLRVGGRLSRSALPLEAKHPVILPKVSHVTMLILREIHEISGHSGRNHMMSLLQQKYWIPGTSSLIRSMMGKCVMCKRQRGKVIEQKMADLPDDRLRPDEPPFTRVGMDYFGPIEVKRGRSVVKRYGVLFTCMAIRAVHIELAHSLDTDSCIDAMRRFMARRGNVREIRSDNGTNLVGAERELRREIGNWNQSQINNTLLQKNVKWTFNPPGGSHHGGVWERMIRTVRKLLFSLTRQQTLTDESLNTLFCEVEGIINSRPITMVNSDVNDVEALTPNHLLLLNAKPQLPPTVTSNADVYARRRWRQVQYLSDVFWTRWVKEYLPQLQARQRWVSPKRNIEVGDVVLLVDEHAPRNSWLMGRILQTKPDKRGFVRQCEVKTRTGVFLRPVSKLCLLLEGDT